MMFKDLIDLAKFGYLKFTFNSPNKGIPQCLLNGREIIPPLDGHTLEAIRNSAFYETKGIKNRLVAWGLEPRIGFYYSSPGVVFVFNIREGLTLEEAWIYQKIRELA